MSTKDQGANRTTMMKTQQGATATTFSNHPSNDASAATASGATATAPTIVAQHQPQQSSAAGRSVVDYSTPDELRQALQNVTLSEDWKLPVPDPDAEEQTVDGEWHRLLTLKSYLLLDAEKEEAFDRITEQARQHYNVPTSLISLVDLGRQFLLSNSSSSSTGVDDDNNNNNNNKDDNKDDNDDTTSVRETPRRVAFCAHTILNRNGICVVKDTFQDDRFRENKLVTEPPHLRFYAGAPLISPEGYKLGTFCVEGPEPRHDFTAQEELKLQEFAAQTMQLMVERRQAMQQQRMLNKQKKKKGSSTTAALGGRDDDALELRRHAAVTTNLGRILYSSSSSHGCCVPAMKLFQESVQTLMYVEDEDEGIRLPSKERQQELSQLLSLLSSESNTESSRMALIQRVRAMVEEPNNNDTAASAAAVASSPASETETASTKAAPSMNDDDCRNQQCIMENTFPGLFGTNTSKLKGNTTRRHEADLCFAEAFQISMVEKGERKVDFRNFIIPMDQSSKATLFNMGLIHYHWGSPDSAFQFFDLAASLSQANTPLAFDPVVLACLNNMAQIHLQYGRGNDAMELLSDALTRGNAALAAMYTDDAISSSSSIMGSSYTSMSTTMRDDNNNNNNIELVDYKSQRLRRKLARTVMNVAHVHFVNCDYDASMETLKDAMRLLHNTTTNMEDFEAAAAWHNIGALYHHQGNRMEALKYIDKFLDRAQELVGPSQHQVADALYRKGQILFEMGNLYECMKPLNESLRIRKERLGKNHAAVAESLCLIGKVLQAREEYDFALSAMEEGLAVMRSQSDTEELSLDAAQTLLEVGRAYHVQGNMKESLRVYTEVLGLTRKFFGDRHPFVARIVNIIGNLHLELGEVDESLRLFEDAMKMHVEQGLPVDLSVVHDPLLGVRRPQNPTVAPTA